MISLFYKNYFSKLVTTFLSINFAISMAKPTIKIIITNLLKQK